MKFGAFINHHQLKQFIYSFARKILGVKQPTENDFVYGELGRIDFQARRYTTIIKYWFKLIYSEENKYIKQVYNMMLNDMES